MGLQPHESRPPISQKTAYAAKPRSIPPFSPRSGRHLIAPDVSLGTPPVFIFQEIKYAAQPRSNPPFSPHSGRQTIAPDASLGDAAHAFSRRQRTRRSRDQTSRRESSSPHHPPPCLKFPNTNPAGPRACDNRSSRRSQRDKWAFIRIDRTQGLQPAVSS